MVTRLESRNFVTPVDLGVVQSKAIISLLTIHNSLWKPAVSTVRIAVSPVFWPDFEWGQAYHRNCHELKAVLVVVKQSLLQWGPLTEAMMMQ